MLCRVWNIIYEGGSKSFRPDIQKPVPNGKCCEGYIVPSMVRLIYQFQVATCSSMLEALVLVVVLLLSPEKVGQARNFWTPYINILHKNCNVVHFFHTSVKVSCRTFTVCWTLYTLFSLQLKPAIMSSSTSKFIWYFLTVPTYTYRNVCGGSLFPSSYAFPSALNPSDIAFSSIVCSSKI